MNPNDALDALRDVLVADTTLAGYVKAVFLGVRDRISVFPSIVLEPLTIIESNESFERNDCRMSVAVIGYLQEMDAEKQIVGDATHTGILTFLNDIKKAICADPTLGGYVIDAVCPESHFEFVNYPIRSVTVGVELLFRQNSKARV